MTDTDELLAQAIAVLRDNDRGHYTVPAPGLYPHQWLWDSCFVAIGLRHSDVERAQTEILSLLRGQWHNGMLPHMIFHDGLMYEGDRRLWHSALSPLSPDTVATSGITQSPMLAEAIVRVGERLSAAERRSWYKRTYPSLLCYHQWLYQDRDPQQHGLVINVHPWETGMDNTPPWMTALHTGLLPYWIRILRATHFDSLVGSFRRDTRHVPATQRPTTVDVLALFSAQRHLRRHRYEDTRILSHGVFAIEDAAFNAMLIRANTHLCAIARDIRQEVPPLLMEAITRAKTGFETLWDPYTSQYHSRDSRSGQLLKDSSIAALLPLYAGSISKERAKLLVSSLLEDDSQFGPANPVPTVAVNSPWFNAECYWQGPVWVNMNWLIIDGLRRYGFIEHAEALRDITLELAAKQGMREYFNPLTGDGLGAQNFSWTAALVIDLLKQK